MDGRPDRVPSRVIIEGVEAEIDGGRFPIKRTVGEEVHIWADIHADGHDVLAAVLRYRHTSATEWKETVLEERGNDPWMDCFPVTDLGRDEYTIQAWINRFASWRRDLSKKVANQDVTSELLEGAELVTQAARRARSEDGDWLRWWADSLGKAGWVRVPLGELGLRPGQRYQVHDLLTDGRFLGSSETNFVRLDPNAASVHILRVRKRIRTERDFDYFF